MGKERSHVTESILKLTLEIIYLLTGEDYGPVKKPKKQATSSSKPGMSGARDRTPEPLPCHKILEITNQIIELLSAEVSATFQENNSDSSMDEWMLERCKDENLKGEMETPQGSKSPDYTDDTDLSDGSSSPAPSHDDISDRSNAFTTDVPDFDRPENTMGASKTERFTPTQNTPHSPSYVKEEIVSRARGKVPTLDRSPHTYIHRKERSTSGRAKNVPRSKICTEPKRNSGKYSHTEKGRNPISPVKEEPVSGDEENLLGHPLPSWTFTKGDKFKKKDTMCYICVECGKNFPYKSHLLRHQKIHMEERPYSCHECGKSFKLNSNLISHLRIHSGQKPFSCSQCGKCFISKSELVKHERIHTGEKPYHCSECGRKFSRISNLIDHSKIHTGEKPHCCTECGKCFRRHSNLLSHQKTHAVEKVYSCPQCTVCFFTSSELVKHQQNHSEGKPMSPVNAVAVM
ncbi:uncharacterized protein [Engystomops pustulosus]